MTTNAYIWVKVPKIDESPQLMHAPSICLNSGDFVNMAQFSLDFLAYCSRILTIDSFVVVSISGDKYSFPRLEIQLWALRLL